MALYDAIFSRLNKVGRPDSEGRRKALCPLHDDRDASLHLFPTGGAHCFGACDRSWTPREFADALGIDAAPFPETDQTYDYTDELGKLIFQVVRRPGKKFYQRRPDPHRSGEWVSNLRGVRVKPLYRLPELVASDKASWIFVVEGEKDADRLAAEQLVATTNAGGAGKWRPEYSKYFEGRKVAILPDNDPGGVKHGIDVAGSILDVAETIRLVDLEGVSQKGDVSDWLDAGGTAQDLLGLVQRTPEFNPAMLNGRGKLEDLEDTSTIWEGNRLRPISMKIMHQGLLTHGRFIRPDNGQLYYFDDRAHQLCELRGVEMEEVLNEDHHVNKREALFQELLNNMTTEANRRGERAMIHQFAFYNEKANQLYIDLGSGRMLRLDGQKIAELDNGSDGVLFTPAPFSEPWTYRPDAAKGILSRTLMGSLKFSTASDSPHTPEQQQVLMMMWLLAIPFESVQPTKPLALLLGPAGSGKSNLWRRVGRMLYGPRFELDTVKRDGENDFLVAVTNSPFVALDNVDHWVPWLDDALATSATGMQVTKKELYTTNRSVSYRARAFLALTARTPRFRREDVAERLIIFTLDKIEERKAEHDLLMEVQENRDLLMSDYAHMLNDVVRVTDYKIADPGMRLADFGNIASRIAASLYMADEAVEILEGLKQAQHIYATEENPLYLLLDAWTTQGAKDAAGKMMGATNSGRGILAKQLFLELKALAEEQGLRWRINNPIGLGKQIMAIEDALSIYFTITKRETKQGNMYTFTRRDPKEIEDTMAEADRG